MPFSDFLLFQSTLLQEERLSCYPEYTLLLHFNPRSYKRSDAYFPCFSCDPVQFQSTLLQEERPFVDFKIIDFVFISIHAPTRGATFTLSLCLCTLPYFNPRSYKRSDTRKKTKQDAAKISIHAPTRGATTREILSTARMPISIHAPTRGATAKMHNIPYASLQ